MKLILTVVLMLVASQAQAQWPRSQGNQLPWNAFPQQQWQWQPKSQQQQQHPQTKPQAQAKPAAPQLQGLEAFQAALKSGTTLSLAQLQEMLYGKDYLNPSSESVVGQFIAKTHAPTLVRRFWRAPEYSINPPHKLGPPRLVIAVTPDAIATFKKFFGSKHFLFLLNEHGNYVAFKNKRSSRNGDRWNGQVLSDKFEGLEVGRLAIPMLLSSSEGGRAENFFALGLTGEFWGRDGGLARYPWNLSSKDGKSQYCATSAWDTGCGTWIANMPIGDELVSEFHFASGDDSDKLGSHQKLKPWVLPEGIKEGSKEAILLRKVWTVPGHKQLGELLEPGANRRGELDNAGFTSLTFAASAKPERVPFMFLFVAKGTKSIPKDFPLPFEDAE